MEQDYRRTLAAVQVMKPTAEAKSGESSVPGGGIVLPSDNPQNPDAPIS